MPTDDDFRKNPDPKRQIRLAHEGLIGKTPKRHKYGVAPKEERTVDGITFDSKKEAERYKILKLAEEAGDITDLELQPRYSWNEVNTANKNEVIKKREYRADFRYTDKGGKVVVEDVKGVRTREYKRKKKLVEKLYGIEIVEV